ncbi:glutathione S-transferase family protein [Paracoccus beibuensis]|uniref:glutathione S-transferase family protein n=1 Tax=Paracoccus beibuensis TaxID=547602 RepID=UPI00223F2E22|nr:glutathione S-transferase [Paracoccus beibuensis]
MRDLRVRRTLEEDGRPYAVRFLSQGAQKRASHRALQPFGQVPTQEEGDLALFESGAIVWHIAGRFPGLMPTDAAARAKSLVGLCGADTPEPPIMDHPIATLFEADKPWSVPRLPSVRARIEKRLGEAADRLGDAEWFGGSFGAGNLLMISVLRIIDGQDMLRPWPNLAANVAHGTSRGAFRALADHMAGFTGTAPDEFLEWQRQMEAKAQIT